MVDRKICPICGAPDSFIYDSITGKDVCHICGYDNTMCSKWQYTITLYGHQGVITTVALNQGGTGYAVNDTIRPVQSGSGDAILKVTSVSDGAVTGLSIMQGGYGYSVANNVSTTALSGSGTGCKVNITEVRNHTVTGASNGDKFGYGELVEVKTTPYAGYTFARYEVNGVPLSINPIPLAIIKDYTIKVVCTKEVGS
ncbi:MAG: hypothetical protein ACPLKS_06085 [Caldisericum exile]|uniref:hypothetical protein n=1 Tax=Caldisericum exile TaxID=693075 RepID=UPI003C71FE9B